MTHMIDPKRFGLHARTVLEEIDDMTVAIVINRKSRIIMADGKKILEKAGMIRQCSPGVKIILKTSAPVCSKTTQFLAANSIMVITG